MKQENATNIYDKIRLRCESTPFREINLGGKATIRQYWTKSRSNTQVYTVIHDYTGEGYEVRMGWHLTSGGNYCKEASGYWTALRSLGYKTKEDEGCEGSGISHKYCKGGNFYNVPVKQLLKYK